MTPSCSRLALAVALLAVSAAPALALPTPVVPVADGRWYAVQLHAHSRYSDGVHPIASLVAWARESGLDALAVTDHNTRAHLDNPVYQADNGVRLIPAYEWTEGFRIPGAGPERCHASIWGLGPDTPVLSPLLDRDALVAAVASQGVTVGANHPYETRFPWPDENFDGVSSLEVWQWQYGLEADDPNALPEDVYVPRSNPMQFLYRNSRAIALWQRLLRKGRRITPVAVADFHVAGPQDLASPVTLVWSRNNQVASLLAGIRAGHVTLAEGPHAARVELWADADGDGRFEAMPGDQVPVGTRLQVRVQGAAGERLSIVDAEGVASTREIPGDAYSVDLPATKAGFYFARVDRAQWYSPLHAMTGAVFVK